MRRILLLLTLFCSVALVSLAQQIKPCGTSVLARGHAKAMETRTHRKAPIGCRTYTGEKHSLIILVDFPNQHFSEDDVLQKWSDIANLEGYADNGATGSAGDYFRDQSYGQFRLVFDVVGPVEAQHEYAYYGDNKYWGDTIGWFDQNVGALVEEACKAVERQVRFSDYDWDGDGEVDQLFLLYAGHGENDYSNRDSTVIWPHMAVLSVDWDEDYPEGITLQDMRIDTYACGNEIDRKGSIAGIGTFCHEFSHCLGLPDLYNAKEGTSVLGRYDVMDLGSYNGNGWCPPGYSSYERYVCGWLSPTLTDHPEDTLGLRPLHQYPDANAYFLSEDSLTVYFVEYREKVGWDAKLPSAGYFVWYVDYDEKVWKDNEVNSDPAYLRVNRLTLDDLPTAVSPAFFHPQQEISFVYDLHGRRLPCPWDSCIPLRPSGAPRIYLVRMSDGTYRKVLY